ncbi:MAG TPA: hypothetical protein VFF64_15290 [Candidatus Eremiobacteraceae bacterium]|nr:hypothetical protein [Candidatus Eremiobacteraceae bacterium]
MDDPKQLVNRFVEELWNERRLDVADAIFAKDCVTHLWLSFRPRTVMRSRLRLQFASRVAVLTAVVSLDGETAVGPELPLGTETVGCLQRPCRYTFLDS